MNVARLLGLALFCASCTVLSPKLLSAQEPARVPELLEVLPRLKHPEPRPNITARKVLPSRRFASAGQLETARVYDMAREIPEVLDGIYSYCHKGRSLLSCFESTWGAQCEYCQTVVKRAYQLHRGGHSLAYIRRWHVGPVPGVDGPSSST